ncbi:MAG: VOC family protein [Cyanobacteria bacterium P01_A01_bin.83]
MEFNSLESFVTIATEKFELVVDFYSKLCKQEPIIYRPSIYAEFQLNKLRIGIFKPKPENYGEFSHNYHSSISICLSVVSLEQAIAFVSNLGYPPSGEIVEASHGREIYAYDPAGNRLILHQASSK